MSISIEEPLVPSICRELVFNQYAKISDCSRANFTAEL
jgi:hypothetical protein